MLGEALPPRSYQRNLQELDALLGSMDSYGFNVTTAQKEAASNARQAQGLDDDDATSADDDMDDSSDSDSNSWEHRGDTGDDA